MQCLTGTNLKTVLYKLAVPAVSSTFQYLVSSVTLIAEQRVSDMLHVHPYLMCAPGLQAALHQLCVTKALQNGVVGHGMLAHLGVK